MGLFRNSEIKKSFLAFFVISLLATVAALIWDVKFGIFTLALCAVLGALYLLVMRKRYRRIARLSEDINKILHGDNTVSLDTYSEGELGILQSELHKMTVCLDEQRQTLQNDKVYLADSIADISHQIRTPLTSINLLVSFLSDPDISDARRHALTRELFDLLSRIDWLITTLLKMSKLDAGAVQFKQENASLRELIDRSCAPILVPMELRGQTLSVRAEGSFFGDLAWTCEALGNIIKNCMEHTPKGGKITVSAVETALYSEIVIEDNGSGIAEADLPHIFERFYKGKNSDEKSFGIGLALARCIVAEQNGTVKAENKQDGGARFTVRFYKGTI